MSTSFTKESKIENSPYLGAKISKTVLAGKRSILPQHRTKPKREKSLTAQEKSPKKSTKSNHGLHAYFKMFKTRNIFLVCLK